MVLLPIRRRQLRLKKITPSNRLDLFVSFSIKGKRKEEALRLINRSANRRWKFSES
jgi:hypothetical protein